MRVVERADEAGERLIIRLARLIRNRKIYLVDAFGAAEVAQGLRALRSAKHRATFPNPQAVDRSGLLAATRRKSDDAYQRRAEKQHAAAGALEANYSEPGQAGATLILCCSFQSVRPGRAFPSARVRS